MVTFQTVFLRHTMLEHMYDMHDNILQDNNGLIRLKQQSRLVSINKRATCSLTCKNQREIDEITYKHWPELLQELDFHVENQNVNEIEEITNLMVEVQNYLAEISDFQRENQAPAIVLANVCT